MDAQTLEIIATFAIVAVGAVVLQYIDSKKTKPRGKLILNYPLEQKEEKKFTVGDNEYSVIAEEVGDAGAVIEILKDKRPIWKQIIGLRFFPWYMGPLPESEQFFHEVAGTNLLLKLAHSTLTNNTCYANIEIRALQ